MKQIKLIKTHQSRKNTNEHKIFAKVFILFRGMGFEYKEDEEWKRYGIVHFSFLTALSLAASILRYSSTSSIGVSLFFPIVL